MVVAILLSVALTSAVSCFYINSGKGRDPWAGAGIGFLFGVFGLAFCALRPSTPEAEARRQVEIARPSPLRWCTR